MLWSIKSDKEHSDMIWGIFEKNAVEEPGYLAVIEGTRESLQIDGAFGLAMEAIDREVACTEFKDPTKGRVNFSA